MLHRVATKRREKIKWMTMQKMARPYSKEGGNHLEQEHNKQKTVDALMGGYILQRTDKALVKGEMYICTCVHAYAYVCVWMSVF